MERDEERIRNGIEGCIAELRSDIETLETSKAIDNGLLRELMQVVEDIEGHVRATAEA